MGSWCAFSHFKMKVKLGPKLWVGVKQPKSLHVEAANGMLLDCQKESLTLQRIKPLRYLPGRQGKKTYSDFIYREKTLDKTNRGMCLSCFQWPVNQNKKHAWSSETPLWTPTDRY